VNNFFDEAMSLAIAEGEKARLHAPPNPWVGAVLYDANGHMLSQGHTQVPGASHAEVEAIERATGSTQGATLVVTLEPCCHVGRTGPCVEAILAAGIATVVVGMLDPDPRVAGRGVAALREAGVTVVTGVRIEEVRAQLAPYLWHRVTGRPYVVAKVASTLDGIVAMADGTSQWITGEAARADAHVVRAQSQAIVVGAGTVRADNPRLTARLGDIVLEPLRVVMGTAPADAAVRPCLERSGSWGDLLDELGERDVLQVLIEGGPRTFSSALAAGVINHVCWYLAPAIAGAHNTTSATVSLSTGTMAQLRRARFSNVTQLGDDIRLDLEL
jgi:diaminohydroxyphosphoribosylaminopyrimidine deaminase/5-amino-6-(5-phosphoribosylamino)uracil reductase